VLIIEGNLFPLTVRLLVEFDNVVPEACEENTDLDGPASNQIVESNRAPGTVFEEDHKEPEANEDHHMDILEKCIFALCNIHGLCFIFCKNLGCCELIELSEQTVEQNADRL
jgi:hypothetical protein